jgi:tRNA(Ile)-lysidine synthase
MIRKVERFMRENKMTAPGDSLIVGISGGADSVCLLYILWSLRRKLDIKLTACHVVHGIRGEEAERDAAHTAEICEKLGVPLRVERRDVPYLAAQMNMTIEEAGRYARRQIFSQLMKETGAQKTALAHHMDDLAETVFMNAARGTGIKGLASLRPVRGSYIRPLLCADRSEIEDCLMRAGLSYCTDSTNLDTEITRNAVRHILLPKTEEMVNKKAGLHLAMLSREAAEVTDFLESECEFRQREYVKSEEDAVFIAESFLAEPHLMQSLIIKRSLCELAGTEKDFTRGHVEDILKLCANETGRRIDLPYRLLAVRKTGGVCICRRIKRDEKEPLSENVLTPGTFALENGVLNVKILECDGAVIPQNMYTKTFDYDKIKDTLKLRTRLPGDFIVINPDGRRKSFSNYLTDMKVDKELRDRIPLVTRGSEILWAIGMRSGESCRTDEKTTRALVMTFSRTKTEE